MNRTYSNLTVRTISEDQRIIEGIATTASLDRTGDIVVSEGAHFNLPIPFMLDHNHTKVVGEVELAEVIPGKGIRFRARIKKIAEPGPAKDLVDQAWSLVKNGLRRFVSIGFRPLSYETMPGGGNIFHEWEWLELSAVAVPAQGDARITETKAARGAAGRVVTIAGHAARSTHRVVKLTPQDIRRGKIMAAAQKRRADDEALRKRLGLPGHQVFISPSEAADAQVEEMLRKARAKRQAERILRKPSRVVKP